MQILRAGALLTVLGAWGGLCLAAQEAAVAWKPVAMAMLRVDDHPAKTWRVYRAEKRKNSLLVQLGARFLMLDVEARTVHELDPTTLARKDDLLEWHDRAKPAQSNESAKRGDSSPAKLPAKKLLPSTGWTMRDVGPMLRITFTLTAEGREFNLQLPIQPDLRKFY